MDPMQLRIEVTEMVHLKAVAIRERMGKEQFDNVFNDLIDSALTIIFKEALKVNGRKLDARRLPG
jgi:hypothetical protein